MIGTYRSEVAYEVMTENLLLIKRAKVNHQFVAGKLLEKKIINARERDEVTDKQTGCTVDERMDRLLELITASISMNGEEFGVFLEILREEDTSRSIGLANKLKELYNGKLK